MDDQSKTLEGRELDAAVAEHVMEWERVMLFDHSLNLAFFADPETNSMYTTGKQMPYLVRPGRMSEGDGQVAAREMVGTLTIGGDQDLPCYSTDIAAAMQVIEKMRQQGWSFACTLYAGKLPYASFCRGTAVSSRNAEAESLSEAICRAAYAAAESCHRQAQVQ